MIRLVVILVVAASLLVSCNNKSNPVTAPEVAVDEEGGKKPLGTPLWRKACFRLTYPNSDESLEQLDFEKPISEEADEAMASCLKGFMTLKGAAPDEAANCILQAKDQEAMFECMQNAVSHGSKTE